MELLVEHEDAESLANAFAVGDEVGNLLHRLHLLLQVLALDEVTELRVVAVSRSLVQLQQGLVHLLIKLIVRNEKNLNPRIIYLLLEEESELHRQQRRVVVGLCRGLLDALHQQTATPHVQVGHHLHAMLALLVTRLLEEVVEALQSNVILGKVRSLQK